ncbi:hypothetical protein NERG_00934 [Nematocida ausubeli]|uniref:Sm domain-containing protein n=1 Tax=Nematocida ausubeli (strain ATCC PRA-371 / ERTm2) TaxID=1913371 RepID=H8ZBI5_NEMA1|nr:hypothetical protein NERG_00934 [Nematocida ausubeli]
MQPVEWIEKNKGERVRVVLRTGRVYSGTFISYDSNVNILFEDLSCWNTKEKIGKSILNGTTVAYMERLVN